MPDDEIQLFKELIRETAVTRQVLIERFDHFETELRRELRAVGSRLDIVAIEINKMQGQARDLNNRVLELEQKPA
jgi:hypothetical protein